MKNASIKSLCICTILFLSAAPNLYSQWQWLSPAYTNAGNYGQSNLGVAVDPNGGVYTTGSYLDKTTGDFKIPFRKFAADGKLVFFKLINTGIGVDNLEIGNDIGVNLAQNRVVIGGQQHGGSPYLGFFRADNGSPASPASIAFTGVGEITKIDVRGDYVWVIGNFSGSLALGGGGPTLVGSSLPYGNIFIAKYNMVTGAHVSSMFLQSSYLKAYDIKVDAGNNVYFTARAYTTVNFYGSPASSYVPTNTVPMEVFAAKLSPTYGVLWAKPLGVSHGNYNSNDRYPIALIPGDSWTVAFGGYNSNLTSSFLQIRSADYGTLFSQISNIPNKTITDLGVSNCTPQSLYVVGGTFPNNPGLYLNKYSTVNLSYINGQTSNPSASGAAMVIDGVNQPIVTGNYSGGVFTINGQSINVANQSGGVTGLYSEPSSCCSNRGLILDGANDYLSPSALPLSGSGNFTFEAWVNSSSSGPLGGNCNAAFRRLLGWGLAGGHQVEIGDCNGLLAVQYTGLNGSGAFWPTGMPIRNAWNHIALVKSGNNLTLYMNGTLVFSSPTSLISFPTNSVFYIGRPVGTPNGVENWKGRIDEVRLWNVARTATQVFDKRGCRLKGNEPGLLLYYPFEHGTPGGNNTGANIAYNYASSVTQYATLYNFAFTGGLSNWICASQTGLAMNGTCTPFGPGGDERSEELDAQIASEDGAELTIKIFPNPNSGRFSVRLPEPATADMTLRIVSLSGQLMVEKQTESGMVIQALEADDLPAGLYFLHVVTDGKMLATAKFVKQ